MPQETIESRAFNPDLLVRTIIGLNIACNYSFLTQPFFVIQPILTVYINHAPDNVINIVDVMKTLQINPLDYATFWFTLKNMLLVPSC